MKEPKIRNTGDSRVKTWEHINRGGQRLDLIVQPILGSNKKKISITSEEDITDNILVKVLGHGEDLCESFIRSDDYIGIYVPVDSLKKVRFKDNLFNVMSHETLGYRWRGKK